MEVVSIDLQRAESLAETFIMYRMLFALPLFLLLSW
jgi:hypothetical protein